jgi:hypothetical protein
MRRRTVFLATFVAAVLLVTTANPALAVIKTASETHDGMTITARINRDYAAQTVTCDGKNLRTSGTSQDKMLVSYVCQYFTVSGTWVDWHTAPSITCTNCSVVGWPQAQDKDVLHPCSFFGGSGTVSLRAQADGWYENPNRVQFAGTVVTDYLNYNLTNNC